MAEPPIAVRPATAGDVDALAGVLASAFTDDPVFAWLLPDRSSRTRRAGRVFQTILRSGALRRGGVEVAERAGPLVGGTIWYPPASWQPGVGEQLRSIPGYVRALGRRVGPAAALLQALAGAHPTEPHWYLYVIGVEPSLQGHGVASALLASRLTRADMAGVPCYLEASNPSGVPLYEHFGFRPTGEPTLPDGAPRVTAMWRPPRADPG